MKKIIDFLKILFSPSNEGATDTKGRTDKEIFSIVSNLYPGKFYVTREGFYVFDVPKEEMKTIRQNISDHC